MCYLNFYTKTKTYRRQYVAYTYTGLENSPLKVNVSYC